MSTKRRKGFTLVELLVTIVAACIVIMGTGTVMMAGHRFLNKAMVKTNLQRDASIVVLEMSRSVRSAWNAVVQDDGKSIRIYQESGWVRYFFDEQNGDIKLEVEGLEPRTVVSGTATKLKFNRQGSKITVEVELEDEDFESHHLTTIMMRNYEG